jgi:glycine betaine/choline ABC-type transport system substrate-binding protein
MSNTLKSAADIETLQRHIVDNPYSVAARLDLAKAYQAQSYPDLAAGEAYIALLLVDECLGKTGEYEDEACEAAAKDFQHVHTSTSDGERDEVVAWVEGEVKDGM